MQHGRRGAGVVFNKTTTRLGSMVHRGDCTNPQKHSGHPNNSNKTPHDTAQPHNLAVTPSTYRATQTQQRFRHGGDEARMRFQQRQTRIHKTLRSSTTRHRTTPHNRTARGCTEHTHPTARLRGLCRVPQCEGRGFGRVSNVSMRSRERAQHCNHVALARCQQDGKSQMAGSRTLVLLALCASSILSCAEQS